MTAEEECWVRMRPEDLKQKAKTVYDLGTARLADLIAGETGTTAETLTELKTEMDLYSKAVADQGIGAGQQTAATQSIPELFRQADVIIYDEMDDLMEHIEDTYPDLYLQFHEAKQVKELGVRHPSTSSGQAPLDENQPASESKPQTPKQ